MTSEKKTARVDLWLPPSLKLTLELLAEKDRRKLSDYVRLICEEHVEKCAAQVAEQQESEQKRIGASE